MSTIPNPFIRIRSKNAHIKLFLQHILYLQANGNSTIIFTVLPEKPEEICTYTTGYNLGHYKKLLSAPTADTEEDGTLPESQFCTIHAKYLLNLQYFKQLYVKRKVLLDHPKQIILPIGRRFKSRLYDLINKRR